MLLFFFFLASEHNYSDCHRTSGSILNHGSASSALAYPSLYQSGTHITQYYDVIKSEASQESINSPHIVSLASANNNNNNSNKNNNNNTSNKDRPSVLSMSVIS